MREDDRSDDGGLDAALCRELPGLWPAAFAFAMQLCHDRGRAEDLAQSAFLKLLAARERIDPERPLRPLVLSVIRNLARDEARRRHAVPLADLEAPTDDEAGPPATAERLERSDALHEALQSLNPTWRGVLFLADGLDCSYREIAQAFGTSEDVVRTTLHRARGRVRERLATHWTESHEP